MNATDFFAFLSQRQSVRSFLSQPVEPEKLTRCLEAARLAPSACNAQPWTFVVVTEPVLREQVAESAVGGVLPLNHFTRQAPVLIVVVRESPNFTSGLGQVVKNKEFTVMDVGMATLQLSLQATAEGLGSCILGWFNEKRVKELLAIPARKRAELIVALGYPSSPGVRPKLRKPLSEMVRYNRY